MYTPSRPTGGGQWSKVTGKVAGSRWEIESQGRKISGQIQPGAEVVIWDERGCRVEGQVIDPPPVDPPTDPPDGDEIKDEVYRLVREAADLIRGE